MKMKSFLRKSSRLAVVSLLVFLPLFLAEGCEQQKTNSEPAVSEGRQHYLLTDLRVLEEAFHRRQNNLQITQQGRIIRVLADDLAGTRHQRCIVELASGQRLLIAHNIDIAPRIPDLEEGRTLIFHGEYVWNEKGGAIHWTHHDPRGHHENGWMIYQGKTYQ